MGDDVWSNLGTSIEMLHEALHNVMNPCSCTTSLCKKKPETKQSTKNRHTHDSTRSYCRRRTVDMNINHSAFMKHNSITRLIAIAFSIVRLLSTKRKNGIQGRNRHRRKPKHVRWKLLHDRPVIRVVSIIRMLEHLQIAHRNRSKGRVRITIGWFCLSSNNEDFPVNGTHCGIGPPHHQIVHGLPSVGGNVIAFGGSERMTPLIFVGDSTRNVSVSVQHRRLNIAPGFVQARHFIDGRDGNLIAAIDIGCECRSVNSIGRAMGSVRGIEAADDINIFLVDKAGNVRFGHVLGQISYGAPFVFRRVVHIHSRH
mmetsp:Transcript_53798/g.79963  ORF Transcript_53798/g.79963 Transcript_53798/m.79963 type:complete len:312 (+) Transcript_53798:69-1004(+)